MSVTLSTDTEQCFLFWKVWINGIIEAFGDISFFFYSCCLFVFGPLVPNSAFSVV